MPIAVLYYLDRGITFFQMGSIEAIIAVVVILTDIPSGAFADIFGRKLSVGLGFTIWGLSLILTGISTHFWVYFFAGIMMGLSDSLISGAEKALFRHLITNKKARPPKHGIIFYSDWVSLTKDDDRGKMARALASKISISSKLDYFKGEDISNKLIKDLEKKLEGLK